MPEETNPNSMSQKGKTQNLLMGEKEVMLSDGLPTPSVYDPLDYVDPLQVKGSPFSEAMKKEVQVSVHRYNHYMNEPECIRQVEISKYNKEWMSNALKLLTPGMLK